MRVLWSALRAKRIPALTPDFAEAVFRMRDRLAVLRAVDDILEELRYAPDLPQTVRTQNGMHETLSSPSLSIAANLASAETLR